jgi:hypothetical protein
MTFLAGVNNLWDSAGQRRTASSCITHPHYNGVGSSDLAVCKVEIPFVFGTTVNSVTLSTIKINGGMNCSLTGWGSISILRDMPIPFYNKLAYPLDLRIVHKATISNDDCQSHFGNGMLTITDVLLCTKFELLKGDCAGL